MSGRTGSRAATLRLAAQMRELASLGFHMQAAAKRTRINSGTVHYLAKRFGIVFPKKAPNDTPLCRAVRAGYAAGRSPQEIAVEAGTTANVVKARASQMHVKNAKANTHDPYVHKRGFSVPQGLRDQYRELRRLGCTPQECGYELGLIARPTARAA